MECPFTIDQYTCRDEPKNRQEPHEKTEAPDVDRFKPDTYEDWRGMCGGISAVMKGHASGPYVLYEDYRALSAALAAAEAERDALREALEESVLYVETLHSLLPKGGARSKAMSAIRVARAALTGGDNV